MLFHSSINAFLSCARVAGGFRRFLTLLSSSSHMCSIGVKSGLYGGYASGAKLLFARKSWQTRATCGRALSCCRIRLRCCTSWTTTGRKISSLYLTAVILPATIINCDFIPWAMPPQTITEPPPNRSRSRTQASAKRSPRRRYVDHLRDREWTYLWLTLSKGELGQQRQQEGGGGAHPILIFSLILISRFGG